ncbi:MAG: sugar-binding protein [Armatimonadota bacterium]|nr:sugar-binding protein [Armatimonadota bacterium]
MKKYICIALAAGALACVATSGCGKKAPRSGAGAKPVFAVLGKSIHPYWSEVEVGCNAAAKDLGVDVNFVVPPKEDANLQVSRLQGFIAKGVSGIAFAASDPNSVIRVIADASDRGIPSVALDTDAPKSKRIGYIGTDNYTAGHIAGETLGKILGGKGKVAISTGSLSAQNSLDRMHGFEDALKHKFPAVKVISLAADKEDGANALSIAQAALQAHPDLNAFYGVYAINGPACARAVQGAGKVGKVHIVCFDTTGEHMKYIKAGVIDATVGQRPYMMGYKSVEFLNRVKKDGAEKALADMKFSKDRKLDTGVDVVTKAGLEEYRAKLKELDIPVSGW